MRGLRSSEVTCIYEFYPGQLFVLEDNIFHVFNAFYLWISNEIIQGKYNLVEIIQSEGIFQQKQKFTKMTTKATLNKPVTRKCKEKHFAICNI